MRVSDLGPSTFRRSSRDMGRWAQAARRSSATDAGRWPTSSNIVIYEFSGFWYVSWEADFSPIRWDEEYHRYIIGYWAATQYWRYEGTLRLHDTGIYATVPYATRMRPITSLGFGPWQPWTTSPGAPSFP